MFSSMDAKLTQLKAAVISARSGNNFAWDANSPAPALVSKVLVRDYQEPFVQTSASRKFSRKNLHEMSHNWLSKFPFLLLQKQARSLTTKLDVIHLPSRSTNAEEAGPQETQEELGGSSARYSVCREHTTVGQKFEFNKKTVLDPTADFEAASSHPSQPLNSGEEKGYRSFTVSTTQKNVTLPLKSSKLANPFPDPVTVMPSHTVSDEEKAQQMQAESRVPRSISKSRRK